jgi:hypothetical protein
MYPGAHELALDACDGLFAILGFLKSSFESRGGADGSQEGGETQFGLEPIIDTEGTPRGARKLSPRAGEL